MGVGKDLDYLQILEAIERLPFGMGKKLLTDVLAGDSTNETVKKHRLDREQHFGCLSGYGKDEIQQILSSVSMNGLVEKKGLPGKTYFKVYTLTVKGKEELRNPTLNEKKLSVTFTPSPITHEDELIFKAFDFFLKKYNPEQKQAIVSRSERVLCVAGAGSGKTTVLTKRIEFLTRFCGVQTNKVLAITFTRKARQEMQHRLGGGIQVETFNSFCERILTRHGQKYYGKAARMIQYKDRMRLVHHALKKLNLAAEQVVSMYFTQRQRSDKSKEELFRLFVHDVFSILDYYANNAEELTDFSKGDWNAKMVYNICRSIRQEMKELGLRDYSDQLTDAIALFKQHPELIPNYEHVLVDEYQDVNAVQKQLLNTLNPQNLFVVGDPRQSIFGWRGSKVGFIIKFPEEHSETQTIILSKNYRSKEEIVTLSNVCITPFNMPDMESAAGNGGTTFLRSFKSDVDEAEFIAEKILSSNIKKEEVFVLTRTNRQLQVIAEVFRARKINHVLRLDDAYRLVEASEGEVTLSTVHAIKGLESNMVFVGGVNSVNFPCLTTDHPVLELVKRTEHDREEEELRLLYVALTRAKKELHVSYSGTPSRFFSKEMKKLLGASYDQSLSKAYKGQGKNGDLFAKLREWRTMVSRKAGIPPYMVFPDKTLLQLAEMRPSGITELHSVSGIGPSKANRYGEELLELMNNSASN